MEHSEVWNSADYAHTNHTAIPSHQLKPGTRKAVPLCVDLDGTLIKTDLLVESFLALVKRNPLALFLCFWWLLHGKARLKAEIAQRVEMDMSLLPYHAELTAFLQEEVSHGRRLYLCTAADRQLAQQVAAHLGIFDAVLASDGRTNLSGKYKAALLSEKFGESGFDYCGNSHADLAIWKHAQYAIVVGHQGAGIVRAAGAINRNTVHFAHDKAGWMQVLKAMRVYQWVKNSLIFVPLLTSHLFLDINYVWPAVVAFFAFSLCASSVYLLNDMLDLEADRRHARKRTRPFASGQLSLVTGMWLTGGLLACGLALALLLPIKFMLVLAAYYALTLAYSFALKKMLLVDVFALAGLYTSRILAGGAATDIPLSSWLILFSITIFLSLAFVKRYSELHSKLEEGEQSAAGRGYLTKDLSILSTFGTSAGYLAVIIMAIYLNDPQTNLMYSHRSALWGVFAGMMFWVSWMWMNAYQGKMTDDPIVFALKNRVSLMTIGLIVLCTLIAI
ncbi:4-hydroxybenzoate octaprenyltransferase [Novimethylophilus kurashikiensis]|uniref:4-hydroxybenzoate octaprenyltransferase n=1 Tax=Novimethylophilus kurashikiensis TaxID=1825523 RepID=A0A2R5F738_9PROT|nr:UbiA family prenyltransferase [Novimethylophilus kurashikiensis]GBG14007.1 4-hydroxybenzoate octaprenyltransferase [Novimethylophilus kurashikiensis]